jgi:beta-glucosidase
VQVPESKVPRPIIELRGYQRVTLRPGETRTVALPLRADDLSYWDTTAHRWAVEPGPVRLRIGASSSDLRVDTTARVAR